MLLQAAFLAMFFASTVEVVLVYERMRGHARFYLADSLVTLYLSLAPNILFIGGLDAGMWGFVSSKLITSIGGAGFLAWRLRREGGWHWRGAYVPAFVRFGAPLILSGLSYFAIHFSGHFFLSSAVSLAKLGRSTLAYRFALTVYALVGDSFAKSWTVSPYRHINDPGWQEQFARVAAFFTFAVAWAGFAIAVFCPELLRVTVPASSFSPRLLLPVLVLAYVVRDVAEFRHPLRGNPSRTAFRARLIDRVTEWLVLQQSDAVIANTEASAAALARRYPARAGKTHTICNGFDPDDWMEPLPRADRARGVISHVGPFYGVRTPAPVRCVFEPAGRKRRDAARRHPVPPGRLQRSRTPRCRGACLSGFAGAGLPARRDPDRLTA